MPMIITTAAASARGFGLFSQQDSNDGTKGIFALGALVYPCGLTNIRNKYTYASCASTASGVGTASTPSDLGSAAGNGTRGIFALGAQQLAPTCTRNKYIYSNCSSTASGVAGASIASYGGSAAGNATRGIFALGQQIAGGTTNVRNKYVYSNCTSTACGVGTASFKSRLGESAGNATCGIFQLGYTDLTCSGTTTRNKYTYSNCTSTACGVAAASNKGYGGSAAGNTTRGIFALGYLCSTGQSTKRNKYTYASCTSTACGVAVASLASSNGSATGNSTRGIFALGSINASSCYTAIRDKYTYACCSSTACGVGTASFPSTNGSAASWVICLNS